MSAIAPGQFVCGWYDCQPLQHTSAPRQTIPGRDDCGEATLGGGPCTRAKGHASDTHLDTSNTWMHCRHPDDGCNVLDDRTCVCKCSQCARDTLKMEGEWVPVESACRNEAPDYDHECTRSKGHAGIEHYAVDPVFGNIMARWVDRESAPITDAHTAEARRVLDRACDPLGVLVTEEMVRDTAKVIAKGHAEKNAEIAADASVPFGAKAHPRISCGDLGDASSIEINGAMFQKIESGDLCVGTVAEAELAAIRAVAEAARALSHAAEGYGLRKSDWDRLDEALAALPKETT